MSTDHISITAPQLGTAKRDQITAVPESGTIADGPEARGFEREFADYCGADHGVVTSNRTVALHAAPHALGVGLGDRVLTTPFTFIAIANAVAFAGAEMGFVGIDPRTYNINPDALEAQLRTGERMDATIVVHLYGLPADMTRLTELAAEYDSLLVKDAAQARGVAVGRRHVGSFGDAACFSFYPAKDVTTSKGDMITANRADVVKRAARLVDHGRVSGCEHIEVGRNFRMTNIATAIDQVQPERLPGFTHAKQANTAALTEYLGDSPVTTPHTPPGRTHIFHQYTAAYDGIEHDTLKSYLDAKDIATGVYYPKPARKQSAYEHLAVSAPVAEEAATRVLSLPVHPGFNETDVERVGTAVANYTEVAR